MTRNENLLLLIFLFAALASSAQIYVTPLGNDQHAGTILQPKATLQAALRQARELRRLNDRNIKNGIHIILKGGVYNLSEPVFIRPEDSGTEESPTFIESAGGDKPVFSGGIRIKNWTKISAPVSGLPGISKGKVWVADVPLAGGLLFNFRQLWINNVKTVRAKSANGDQMHRILDWDKKNATAILPQLPLADLVKRHHLEMFIHQWWAIANLRVKNINMRGDRMVVSFLEPESRIQNEHPWPAPWLSEETGNSAFYLTNALEFLDEPGEWYLDVQGRKIYYWPREGENMFTADVTAPYLETLMIIEGTPEQPVKNIFIDGISFQHTGWLRPSLMGHVPHQAGMFMLDAYKLNPPGTEEKPGLDNQAWVGRPTAAVDVSFANHITFRNSNFVHLASTGLDLNKGVKNSRIEGNLFKDIGGTALLTGVFSDESHEIHRSYNPEDSRVVTENISITNNLITDATNEDWSCVGIGAGYVRNTVIAHNEIENVSYSGISMGWGWSPLPNVLKNNQIIANKIHHFGKHNYDCAGIYTLSAQPGTLILDNYIDSIFKAPYAHLPTHWFYLYTDEGSSGMNVKNNWAPSKKFLQNNNGPGNLWENNGPQVDDSVKTKAGLSKSHRYLLNERTASEVKQAINEERNELIELIFKAGYRFKVARLKIWLNQNQIDSGAVYHWKNHYVIYSKVKDIAVIRGQLQKDFPEAHIKVYHEPFYSFSMKKNCPGRKMVSAWDHVILSANLVADRHKQQEYLEYHATQFENWPEVAQGFCNAGFQQLLVFKNGRQLMLVISIPKGENLEKLNPKTTENNPRVEEWNTIMRKYQEGLEGTRPGEKWVELRKY